MHHNICPPLSSPEDTVFIAASAVEYDGKIWWMTYRKTLSPIPGNTERDVIEIARLKPSCSNSMYGAVLTSVPRFRLSFSNNGSRLVFFIEFHAEDQPFDCVELFTYHVANPMSIYDYADAKG